MTTIAFDGKLVAADRRISGDGHALTHVRKLHSVSGRWIVASAGTAADCDAFLRWVKDHGHLMPDNPAPNEGDEFQGLVIDRRTGKVTYYDLDGKAFPVTAPIAIGSGAQYARGAMLAGKDARAAVKIAAQCDGGTGGKIDYLRVGK